MAELVPKSPDTLLTREQTAAALTEAGYPVRPKTLATKASRPGATGAPPYSLFGARALYRWGDAIAWAQHLLSPTRTNTAEGDMPEQKRAARGRPTESEKENC